jgi:hypothetical protein
VVLAERQRTKPNTAIVVGAALAGAIAGGAIPFMLSGRKNSGTRTVRREDRDDLHVDYRRTGREGSYRDGSYDGTGSGR